MSAAELVVLGVPEVRLGGHRLHLRTNKTLALLIYLALEPGPHHRDELAELLWPTHPNTARSSLRFELHHLQTALGDALQLLTSHQSVEIPRDGHLRVDALSVSVPGHDPLNLSGLAALALWRGEFLQGFRVKDSPTWDEWAGTQAVVWAKQFDELLERQFIAQFRDGQLWEALATARRRVRHDSFNEDAYHQLAQVQLAIGQRAEVEVTRRTYREVMRRELGLEDLDLTSTRESPRSQESAFYPGDSLPLVRREALLRQMDEAWDAGKVVFLAGEGGAGKSRLAEEFVARHHFERFSVVAHQTDAGVPFSVQARNIRTCLDFLGRPQLPVEMRRWLAFIVPELWPGEPAQFHSPADRLRFYDAFTAFIDVVMRLRPRYCFVNENLHHWDRESHALGAYTALNGRPQGVIQRGILTYRPEAMPDHMLQQILPVVAEGGALILPVPPLSIEEVHDLIAQLEPGATVDLASRLHRYTGGNPLFVLEAARLLQERGGLSSPDYRELPRSPRIQAVLVPRLSQLSREARDVMWLATLAGADFTFEVAARVLSVDELCVVAAVEELERLRLFRSGQMAHELIADTARTLIPGHVRTVFHRRLLDVLSGDHAPPATLARHALGADRWSEAHSLLTLASQEARALLAHSEAADFSAQAKTLLQKIGGLQIDPGSVRNEGSGP